LARPSQAHWQAVEHDLVQPPLVLLLFFFFFGSTTADLTRQANGTPKSSSLLDGGTTSFATSTEWGYTLQVPQWNNPFYHLNNSCEPSLLMRIVHLFTHSFIYFILFYFCINYLEKDLYLFYHATISHS
jgi:hypothetical protein